jgi:hypothetical protein
LELCPLSKIISLIFQIIILIEIETGAAATLAAWQLRGWWTAPAMTRMTLFLLYEIQPHQFAHSEQMTRAQTENAGVVFEVRSESVNNADRRQLGEWIGDLCQDSDTISKISDG